MHDADLPPPQAPPQKIFRFRRDYNAWVADETLEDYALRYTCLLYTSDAADE